MVTVGLVTSTKLAVRARLVCMVNRSVAALVVRLPDQLVKAKPAAGVAVRA